jgi:hypothetical protein
MAVHLQKQDYGVIILTLLIPLVAGWYFRTVGQGQLLNLITYISYIAVIGVGIGLLAVYKGRSEYGGKMGRALETTAIGLALFMVAHVPHVEWHIAGLPDSPLGPGWLQFTTEWWTGFFHIGAIMFFLLASYGFYLFWDISRS